MRRIFKLQCCQKLLTKHFLISHPKLKNVSAVCPESEVDHDREALPLPQNFKGAALEEWQVLGECGGRLGGVPVHVAALRQLELAPATEAEYQH